MPRAAPFTLLPNTLVIQAMIIRGLTISTVAEEQVRNLRLQLDRTAFMRHMRELVLLNPKQIERTLPAHRQRGGAASA